MTNEERKNQDMSVEEILKSIKGVINDRKNFSREEEILELTEVINDEDNDADDDEENLISSESASATSNILENLKSKVNSKQNINTTDKKNALEEIVIEMLRPELKLWLDENLPLLVRQIVEREIKKLTLNKK